MCGIHHVAITGICHMITWFQWPRCVFCSCVSVLNMFGTHSSVIIQHHFFSGVFQWEPVGDAASRMAESFRRSNSTSGCWAAAGQSNPKASVCMDRRSIPHGRIVYVYYLDIYTLFGLILDLFINIILCGDTDQAGVLVCWNIGLSAQKALDWLTW